MARLAATALALLAIVSVSGCGRPSEPTPKDGKLKVVCSIYPIYLFTQVVVGERKSEIELDLMVPASTGCPHDYDMTTKDVEKLVSAKIFIMNGSGLEPFDEKKILSHNKNVKIIDASKGICADCGHVHEEEEETKTDKKTETKTDKTSQSDSDFDDVAGLCEDKTAKHDHDHDHDHEHCHHGEGNPHFSSSPRLAAHQVRNIGTALAEADPAGAAIYKKNAESYAKKLESLADEFAAQLKNVKSKKIVTVHEIFDHLASDVGLEVVATLHAASPGHEPSAGKVAEMIGKLKKAEHKPAAIFVEPQYKREIADKIAEEVGVKVYMLDPVANGPADAGADHYEKVMTANLETLIKALR